MNEVSKRENKLVELLLLMAENYIKTGAEVWRVEDVLVRLALAYDVKEVNVFVITSCIFLTLTYDDGQIMSQIKRVKRGSMDLRKMDQLNSLSRIVCKEKLSLADFEERLLQIIDQKENRKELLIGCMLTAGAFGLFFGGTLIDIIISSLVGIIVCLLQIYIEPICMNSVVYKYVGSFITGIIICVLSKIVVIAHRDIIMIADIMILIPGVMFTNSLRDVLLGDTLSGMLRFVEATLLASAVVLGFITAMFLFGGNL